MPRAIKSSPVQPKRFEVDVRGRKGDDGRNGVDGSSGISGSDGSDGTDATEATRGTDAGDIDLQLKVQKQGDDYQLEAKVKTDGALQSASQAGEFLPAGSDIYLYAQGGQGGDGADGGDGGDGGRGRDGSDATRYSRGEDGQRGGDGGDAGRGTSGADGGRGGRIRVRVGEADTDALAAVKEMNVEGGRGGTRGRHGTPGSGGSGGSGGSSYSWTEDDGKGGTRSESNSGGFSGSSGSSGSSATGYLEDGSTGARGRATIEVVGKDGVREYDDRYRVQTSGTQLKDANADGVFEPGEGVKLDAQFQNSGPMATPEGPLSAKLSGDWVQAPQSKALPTSIAPGGKATVSDLGFTLAKDDKVHGGEGLNAQTSVQSKVVAERVGATLDESLKSTGFTVKYPVQISAITGDRTATRDEPAKVSWDVKNVSTKALGAGSESQRLVQSMLQLTGGDLAAEHLIFKGADGKPRPLAEGIGQAIANLPAGKSVKIEGTIEFAPTAPFYSQVQLTALLDVGALDAPAQAKSIQQREFSVQLARKYATDPDAGVLVVINNRTTKEEIAAWEKLAESLGTKANLWNISLYGGASLTQAVNDVELGPQFAKKTVVVLNNEYDPEAGVKSPIGHLGEKDLLLAAVKARTSTYVVGGSIDIQRQLFPEGVAGEGKTFATRKEHKEAVKQHQAGSDATLGADEVAIKVRGEATPEKLERAAQKVVNTLQKENPDRRYYVETSFKPEKDDSMLSWFKQHDAGSVTITRGADVSANVVLHQQASDVHSTSFVAGAQNTYALAKSLSLPLKLQAIDKLSAKGGDPNLQVVFRAVLSDLAEEQQSLRDRAWNGEVSREEIASKLGDLQAVAAHFAGVDPSSERGKLVLDLIAEVAHMTEQAKTLWDKVLPMRRRTSLDKVSDDMLEDLTKKAFGEKTPDGVKTALKERKEALKLRDAGLSDDARMRMTPYLQPQALWSQAMTSDYDVWAQQRQA